MSNLLERLKAGAQNRVEVEFPGTDVKVRLRVLNNQDALEASMAADRLFRDSEIDVSMQNVKMYETEKETQLIYRACTDMDGKPLGANITEFRRGLTVGQRAWLIERYNELDAASNPAPDKMPDEEFDALVVAVKKNPNTLMSVSSTPTLQRLALFLARQPANLLMGSGHISQ